MSLDTTTIIAPVNLGQVGKSTYQSYVITTTDDPVLTEAQWVAAVDAAKIAAEAARDTASGHKDAAAASADAAAASAVEAGVQANPYPRLVLGGTGYDTTSYLESDLSGDLVKREFLPFRDLRLDVSQVFDSYGETIAGTLIKEDGDNTAPYRALGTTIGGNHGYYMGLNYAAGHGLDGGLDEGSIWSSGGVEYIILRVLTADYLFIATRLSNALTVAGVHTHVEGATNTADFTVTQVNTKQWYPSQSNYKRRMVIDGKEVADTVGTISYTDTVQFIESYDILERSEIINWWETVRNEWEYEAVGDPSFSVSITNEYDKYGNCTVYTDFLTHKDTEVQDIMFLQQTRMKTGVDGDINYYIPKALPVLHGGINYDHAKIDATDTATWGGSRLDYTPARCEPVETAALLPDRVVQLSDNYGVVVGFLPVGSTSVANRRNEATIKALQVSSTNAKIYMSAIDKGAGVVPANSYFSTIGYRQTFRRPTERTCSYVVRTQGADYLYCDWHNVTKLDRVPLDADLAGRDYEVVEERNVTLRSEQLGNSIAVDVVAAGDYGYLVLKIK